jgi:hypothetical protein
MVAPVPSADLRSTRRFGGSTEGRGNAVREGERSRASFALACLTLGLVPTTGVSAAAVSAKDAQPRQTLKQLRLLKDTAATKRFWAQASKPKRAAGHKVAVRARKFRSVTLNTRQLRAVLARAPRERTAAARTHPLVLSLPAPNGAFHRFAIRQSSIMAPGLARKHPEIKTYSGRGLTDPTATIHADLTPLGFRASVRSASGSWYIDPYYVGRNPSVYASYYARHARDTVGSFVERDADAAELSVDRGYYHAADTVTLSGDGFAENAAITITISDPEEKFRHRPSHLGRRRTRDRSRTAAPDLGDALSCACPRGSAARRSPARSRRRWIREHLRRP